MQIVVVTGDRKWRNPAAVVAAAERHPDAVWILGDCPSGLDVMAWAVLTALGRPRLRYLADWDRLGKRAGPARNYEMVKNAAFMAKALECPVKCLGFHENLGQSKGTKNCMDAAKKVGIDTRHVRR